MTLLVYDYAGEAHSHGFVFQVRGSIFLTKGIISSGEKSVPEGILIALGWPVAIF